MSPEELYLEYVVKERSDRDIAEERGTYSNRIRRLRIKWGIPSRDKSEAQAIALQKGRHSHPTKGKPRPEETRLRISEALATAWSEKTGEERARHAERAKHQWETTSEATKELMRQKAAVAVREAAESGSKFERFLFEELTGKGYKVEFHKDDLLPNEKLHLDLYLPEKRVAIEVDGIAHFEPIWGEEYLQKRRSADLQKTGLVLQLGLVFIRIKQTSKSLSEKKKRAVLAQILSVLQEGGESRLVEIGA